MPSAPWLGALLDEADRRGYLLRLIGGGALVVVGIIGVIAVFAPVSGAGFGAVISEQCLFALVALVGVALAVAPLLWRMFGQLRAERDGRIREAERAELAAMVHDQVLHTLALIQRNSGDPKTVARLARGQERSLRNWLYKPTGSASEMFAAAIEQAAAEVEDTYAIAVESVVVGDATVDDAVGALVAAAREAMVNAARHADVADHLAVRRGGAGAGQRVRPRPRRRIRHVHSGRRTGTAYVDRSSAGWNGTAARRRSAPNRARAPRSG